GAGACATAAAKRTRAGSEWAMLSVLRSSLPLQVVQDGEVPPRRLVLLPGLEHGRHPPRLEGRCGGSGRGGGRRGRTVACRPGSLAGAWPPPHRRPPRIPWEPTG